MQFHTPQKGITNMTNYTLGSIINFTPDHGRVVQFTAVSENGGTDLGTVPLAGWALVCDQMGSTHDVTTRVVPMVMGWNTPAELESADQHGKHLAQSQRIPTDREIVACVLDEGREYL